MTFISHRHSVANNKYMKKNMILRNLVNILFIMTLLTFMDGRRVNFYVMVIINGKVLIIGMKKK